MSVLCCVWLDWPLAFLSCLQAFMLRVWTPRLLTHVNLTTVLVLRSFSVERGDEISPRLLIFLQTLKLFAQMQFKSQLIIVGPKVNYFEINFSTTVFSNRIGGFWLACMNVWVCVWPVFCDDLPANQGVPENKSCASSGLHCCQTEQRENDPGGRWTFSSQTRQWHLAEWATEASWLHFNKTPFLLQETGQRLVC